MPLEERIKKLTGDRLSKQEFLDAFGMLLDIVKQAKESNERNGLRLEGQYQQTFKRLLNDIKGSELYPEMVNAIKGDVEIGVNQFNEASLSKLENDFELTKNELRGIARQMKKELEPNIGKIVDESTRKTFKNTSAILKKLIRDELDKFREELEDDIIAELRKEIKNIKKSSTTMLGGGVGKHNVIYKDISSDLDGATKTFSLPAFHKILDVKLSSVPVMRETTDYTVDYANNQITFTSEIQASTDLASGQSAIILYSEN